MNDYRESILEVIRESTSSGLEIERKGIDRYIVHTNFSYPDGDELHIVIKRQDENWILTDEGHTIMWLSYDDIDFETETESDSLLHILKCNNAEVVDGRICMKFEPDDIVGAIHSMIQTLIQTVDSIYSLR